jgi:outer membrane murein-binding lipoprotein Lpp
MGANTATKQTRSQNRLTYLLVGDGTQVGPTIANATILQDMEFQGPLFDAWNRTYATQATMRTALLAGGANCYAIIQLRTAVKDVTAEINQPSVDVDADAVTATKAEINITMSDTTGQEAYLHLIHMHSLIR